jgi:5,10-methylene-tetrahydrofolate dehydrogenase/methenyl tetrahydrofolate cyclohydrolase
LQHINEETILTGVNIDKDVDGFHPLNIGRLAMQGRDPLFVPCTPKGCIELLHRYNVDIKGKRAVVIGRSNIVGMPAALLLQVLLLVYNGFVLVHIDSCNIIFLFHA